MKPPRQHRTRLEHTIKQLCETYGFPDLSWGAYGRIRSGLERHGETHYLEQGEADWLKAALRKLIDAFCMLTVLRLFRGEDQIAPSQIADAIRILLAELKRAQDAGETPALPGDDHA